MRPAAAAAKFSIFLLCGKLEGGWTEPVAPTLGGC